jgi:hypothetical protein
METSPDPTPHVAAETPTAADDDPEPAPTPPPRSIGDHHFVLPTVSPVAGTGVRVVAPGG